MPHKGYRQTAEHVAKRLTPECRANMSAAKRGRVPWNKGQPSPAPRWNKGLRGAQVAWNKGVKTGLGPWRGKIRGPHSKATKAKMSAAKIGKPKSPEHAANILGRMWHGPKPMYQGIQFRSSYEVRFAQMCNDAGLAWHYEPERFNLGRCSYLPDFYLPTLGIYIEVKGYFSEESRQKIALFRKLHPEFPLVVVMKCTLGQFASGMKPPSGLHARPRGQADGGPGLEDQLNGLVAQQCAIVTA
jgi:hypothetical protein